MIYVTMAMLNLTAKETILFKTKHKPCDAELRLKLYRKIKTNHVRQIGIKIDKNPN